MMNRKSKILIVISSLFMIFTCLIFASHTDKISNIINLLNGDNNYSSSNNKPIKNINIDEIALVNTAELGKYKINKAGTDKIGYSNISPTNFPDLCDFIITNNGKICIVCKSDSLNEELYISSLQFLAGGDYDNVLNYFLQSFSEVEKENAKYYFNEYFSSIFKVNITDFPYLNTQKLMKQCLTNSKYSRDQINILISKLKENCD